MVPPPDASAPPVDVVVTGPARQELGAGTTRFAPLDEGGTIELVLGPQGGWHVDLTARGVNLLPEGLTLRYEVRDDTRPTAWNYPVMASLNARRVVADGAGWARVGDRAVFDIRAAGEVTGRMVRIAVRAERGGAVVAEDARTVRVVDDVRP
jgi:hypothetical protein